MKNRFVACTRLIARKYCDELASSNPHDRCQIIVGWPTSVRPYGRQVIKMAGEIAAIAAISNGVEDIVPRERWSENVTFAESTAQH